jgi:hypothetical protein
MPRNQQRGEATTNHTNCTNEGKQQDMGNMKGIIFSEPSYLKIMACFDVKLRHCLDPDRGTGTPQFPNSCDSCDSWFSGEVV